MFVVPDQPRHKPDCTTTEDGKDLEISDLGRRGIVLVPKTKTLVSCAVVIMQLICAFIFAFAKGRLSHNAAQLNLRSKHGIEKRFAFFRRVIISLWNLNPMENPAVNFAATNNHLLHSGIKLSRTFLATI